MQVARVYSAPDDPWYEKNGYTTDGAARYRSLFFHELVFPSVDFETSKWTCDEYVPSKVGITQATAAAFFGRLRGCLEKDLPSNYVNKLTGYRSILRSSG